MSDAMSPEKYDIGVMANLKGVLNTVWRIYTIYMNKAGINNNMLIHMFVFYIVNSYRKIFQRLLLGCSCSPFQSSQLVLIRFRLVFILV